jgi:hypothetical protein
MYGIYSAGISSEVRAEWAGYSHGLIEVLLRNGLVAKGFESVRHDGKATAVLGSRGVFSWYYFTWKSADGEKCWSSK